MLLCCSMLYSYCVIYEPTKFQHDVNIMCLKLEIFLQGTQFLTFSNEVRKCLCIRFVCQFVYVRFISLKYSYNTLKWLYFIQIYYRVFRIRYSAHMPDSSNTETHKRIPIQYIQWATLHLTYLYWTKYNEMIMNHSDVQKYICYKKKKLSIIFIFREQGLSKDKRCIMCHG